MSQPQISGFEVLECLGQGGMASVWKARQLSLDRIVAIKILSPKMAKDISDIERFLKEAKSAAKLKHPGIIQVYDVNAEEGLYYIVMEYVAGYTVGDWLRRKGVLSEDDALLVVDSVADALDYAWGKEGIIHCDIKPDNVIIDSDGTVKLADLGLARTINAMSTQEEEYVMGTPAYMAPEQARGEPDLDCRTDIYSLGAMLYHLVVGKMLFDGSSDDEMMELQTSDATVADPLDLNPNLSNSLCWLIEKMLAKNKENRPTDWAMVRADVAKVKKGRMPHGPALAEGLSAVQRSSRRTVQDFVQTTRTQFKDDGGPSIIIKVAVLLLILGAGVAAFFYLTNSRNMPKPRIPNPPPVEVVPPPRAVPTEQNAMEMFEFANKWAAENAGNYAGAISRFEKVAKETKGTKYSLMAEDEIRKLNTARDEETAKVMAKLDKDAKPLILSSDFDKACRIYEDYAGRMAGETEEKRRQSVQNIRVKQKVEEEEKKELKALSEKKMVELVDRVVAKLVSNGVMAANVELVDLAKASELAGKDKEITEIRSLLEAAIAIDGKILESFSAQVGKEMTVNMNNGSVILTVKEIAGGKVQGMQRLSADSTAMRKIEFDVSSLSPGEKLKRMGSDDLPEVSLLKGLMAFSSKAYGPAKKYFNGTRSIITEKLVGLADNAEKGSVDEDAEKVLGMILKSLGYSVGAFDEVAWLKAVTERGLPARQQKKASEMVQKYRRDFGNTGFIKKTGAILDALSSDSTGASAPPAETPQPLAAVDEVPLPKDLAAIRGDTNAVMALFYRRNLKVTRERTRMEVDSDGQITSLTISGFSIDDISPLAALPNLEVLRCYCARQDEPGQFKESSAFRYFRLKELTLTGWKMMDYSFLRRRMTSLKILGLSGTDIRDIFCLGPLALDELDLSNTKVFSFAALERMRLRKLNVSGTQLKTFDFVKKMSLEELRISDTGTTDISFLRGLNIKCLHMANIRAKDFSVLRTLPLVDLTLAKTKFDDLTILDGKDLRYLDISGTDISNISLLKSMGSLVELNISGTKVTDISPIAECPIAYLNCQNTRIADFRPLKAMPLKSLTVDKTDYPAAILRNLNIENLTSLNGYSLWGTEKGRLAYKALAIDREHPLPPRH